MLKQLMYKIILFLAAFTPHFALAQSNQPKTTTDCEVIAAKGTVRLAKNRHLLKSGSRFGRQDSLIFQQADHVLVIIDKQRHNFIVKPKDKDHLKSGVWSEIPAAIGTRSGKILTYSAFQYFLQGRRWLVLGGEAALEVGHAAFPLDDDHFFYVRYRWTGDSMPVNKRLPQQGQEIIFSQTELFKVDGAPVAAESVSDFALFYFDNHTQKSLEIGRFDIVFPEDAALRAETSVIRARFGDTPDEQEALRKSVEAYLAEVYGEAEREDFEEWWKGD